MLDIINQYFIAWNSHDLNILRKLFDDKIVLKDWDIHEIGIENVLKANENIFKNVPKIKVEIVDIAVSSQKVMVQINVLINENEILEVVDVFSIQNKLITEIKAFKC